MIDRAAGGTDTLLDRTAGTSYGGLFYGIWDGTGFFPPGVSPYGETVVYTGDVIYALVEMVSWSYLGPSASLTVYVDDGFGLRSEIEIEKKDV